MLTEPEALELRDKLFGTVLDGRATIRSATTTVEGALEALEGLYKMCPWMERAALDEANPEPSRGQEMVKAILEGAPGKWWTLALLAKGIEGRQWPAMSHNALRMAAERLVANDPTHFFKDTGTRTGSSTYSFRPFAARPAPANGAFYTRFEHLELDQTTEGAK